MSRAFALFCVGLVVRGEEETTANVTYNSEGQTLETKFDRNEISGAFMLSARMEFQWTYKLSTTETAERETLFSASTTRDGEAKIATVLQEAKDNTEKVCGSILIYSHHLYRYFNTVRNVIRNATAEKKNIPKSTFDTLKLLANTSATDLTSIHTALEEIKKLYSEKGTTVTCYGPEKYESLVTEIYKYVHELIPDFIQQWKNLIDAHLKAGLSVSDRD